MDWIQFIIFAGGVFGCFFWNRSESRADIRHMEAQLQSNRELVRTIHEDMKAFQLAMAQESKDFHGRLERQDAEFKAHLIYSHSEGKK